jgi:hypothetical protein
MTETMASQGKAVTIRMKTVATRIQASGTTAGNCKTLSEKVRSSVACLMRKSKPLLESIAKKLLRKTRLQAARVALRKISLIGNRQAQVAAGIGAGVGGTGAAEAAVEVVVGGTGVGVEVVVGGTGLGVEVVEVGFLGLILINRSQDRRKNSFNCKNKIMV